MASRLLFALILCCSFIVPSFASAKETAFYVSPDGNDSWSGKLSAPNSAGSDGPFATLERARDAVRALNTSGKFPKQGGVTVFLRAGAYPFAKTLQLTSGDSGTKASPVTWRAFPGEKALLTGGKTISGFAPVTDQTVLNRLASSARGNVLRANLRAQGIVDYGEISPARGQRMEVYFRGKFMTIARYPNDGWLTIADVPQTGEKRLNEGLERDTSPVPRGRHYGRFTYEGDRPDTWSESGDIWVHGYWTWDWSDEYLQVAKIDKKTRDIYPREPHHGYGYTKGQRFYFLNVLEELDAPGEWYLDRASGTLYFWPPEPVKEGDVTVSILEQPMLALENTEYVTVRGLAFEAGRGGAATITGGAHNLIAGCSFRNFGMTAAIIQDGKDNGVRSCDMHDLASGGVIIHGGDRKTLTPAGNFADNNHIHDFGIRLKTYQVAVEVTGVGGRVTHNLIHDAPHAGIFLTTSALGNDHVIEYNELHSLAKETGDVGAIYLCARDYTMRGNVVRYNFVHDLAGPGLFGVMGIYLDDFTSGTTVYGNVMFRAGRAILVGGGRNNTVENNIFADCVPSIHVDARGLGWAKSWFDQTMGYKKLMEDMNYRNPPYSTRYPELLTLLDDQPAIPKYNRILRNVSYGGRWLDLYDQLTFSSVEIRGNLVADSQLCLTWSPEGKETIARNDDAKVRAALKGNTVMEGDPGFLDLKKGNLRLKKDSPAWKLGFKPIPFEKIGLYQDVYRKEIPR